MAETFIQVAPDSTGKKIRNRSRVIGADTVHEQAIYQVANDTWVAYANAVAFAQNKHHIALFNAAGSGKIVKVRKLFGVNLQTGAITGVAARFDVKRTTAQSGGTEITPVSMDTNDAALPAQIVVATGATITEGALLFPWMTVNEENTATQALTTSHFQQIANILMEGADVRDLTVREGQGLTVKQITSSTVGSFGWILVFTVEP